MKNDSQSSTNPALENRESGLKAAAGNGPEGVAEEATEVATYTEVLQYFPMLMKVSSCEPHKDKVTGVGNGTWLIKQWITEIVKEGQEIQENRQIVRGVSQVPLQVNIEQLCLVALEFDAKVLAKKNGTGFFLADKKITRLRVVSVIKKAK